MRFLTCYILVTAATIAAAIPVNLDESLLSLYDIDIQGHENVVDREARQLNFYGQKHENGMYNSYVRHNGYDGYAFYEGCGERGGYDERGERGSSVLPTTSGHIVFSGVLNRSLKLDGINGPGSAGTQKPSGDIGSSRVLISHGALASLSPLNSTGGLDTPIDRQSFIRSESADTSKTHFKSGRREGFGDPKSPGFLKTSNITSSPKAPNLHRTLESHGASGFPSNLNSSSGLNTPSTPQGTPGFSSELKFSSGLDTLSNLRSPVAPKSPIKSINRSGFGTSNSPSSLKTNISTSSSKASNSLGNPRVHSSSVFYGVLKSAGELESPKVPISIGVSSISTGDNKSDVNEANNDEKEDKSKNGSSVVVIKLGDYGKENSIQENVLPNASILHIERNVPKAPSPSESGEPISAVVSSNSSAIEDKSRDYKLSSSQTPKKIELPSQPTGADGRFDYHDSGRGVSISPTDPGNTGSSGVYNRSTELVGINSSDSPGNFESSGDVGSFREPTPEGTVDSLDTLNKSGGLDTSGKSHISAATYFHDLSDKWTVISKSMDCHL